MMIFFGIIATILLIYALVVHLRVFFDMIQGVAAMKRVAQIPDCILCKNLLYNWKNYIIKIVFNIIVLVIWGKLLEYAKAYGMIWAVGVYVLLMVVEVIEMVMYVTALFKDEYAYLTRDGVIACMGIMGRNNCTFAWEQVVGDEESHILLVYRKKANSPYRFQFDMECKHAHEIVESFIDEEN